MLELEKDQSFIKHLAKININNVKICAYIAIVLELVLLGRNIYFYGITFHYYVQLYLALLIASIFILLTLKVLGHIVQDEKQLSIYANRAISGYYLFTLLWGVTVTLIDQQSYGQVTAFLINVLIACSLYINNNRNFLLLHVGPLIVLVVGMYFIIPNIKYISGHFINITVFYIFAILGSRRIYNYIRKSYYQEKKLNENNIDLQKLNLKLEKLANYDALTDLANRHYLQNYMQQLLVQPKVVTLYLLDIDHFKLYNDYYGHTAGDTVLRQVAHILKSIAQSYNLFAVRQGGEEFLIVGCDLTNDVATKIANEINEAIRHLQLPHGKSPTSNVVTVSLGFIQEKCDSIESFDDLITKADEALYMAKNNGRNQNIEYSTASQIQA